MPSLIIEENKGKNRVVYLALITFVIGCFFPVAALLLELFVQGWPLSWEGIASIHKVFPSMYVIDGIPVILTVFVHMALSNYYKGLHLIETLQSTLIEKKAYEEKLAATLSELTEILDNSPISYVILEVDGTVSYTNPTTNAVWGEQDLLEKNIFDLSNAHTAQYMRRLKMAMEGAPQSLESYKHVSDGHAAKYLDITLVPCETDRDGHVVRLLQITSDVTKETLLRQQLEESYLHIVRSLASALDARDKYTRFHSANVKYYVEMILKELSIGADTAADILIAAELHDIGKIGVPDSILKKEGSLTTEEADIMKKHPIIGAEILQGIDSHRKIAGMIFHHHEKMDGTGYPAGLSGDEIPFGAQVIAIADAYDAMTTDRVYRAARSPAEALNELLACKGTHFSPALADIFVDVMRKERRQYDGG